MLAWARYQHREHFHKAHGATRPHRAAPQTPTSVAPTAQIHPCHKTATLILVRSTRELLGEAVGPKNFGCAKHYEVDFSTGLVKPRSWRPRFAKRGTLARSKTLNGC